MTRLLAAGIIWLSIGAARAASAVTGLWLTEDRHGVIAIWNCGDRVCARIAGVFLDRPDDAMPVDHRGISECNLTLIDDAGQTHPGLWEGHITDPRNGNVWGVALHLDPDGNLALRGFFLISLLGRTQTWTRYADTPPADCRIIPASGVSGGSPDKAGQLR